MLPYVRVDKKIRKKEKGLFKSTCLFQQGQQVLSLCLIF